MAITGDDQWEWRSFKIGDGTVYPVVRFDMSDVTPRRSPYDRIGGSGAILARADLLGARTLTWELEVEGSSRANLQTKLDALDAATIPDADGDEELDFQLLGTARRVNGRPSPARWLWTNESDTGLVVAGVDLEFYCQDPRVYAGSATVTVLA